MKKFWITVVSVLTFASAFCGYKGYTEYFAVSGDAEAMDRALNSYGYTPVLHPTNGNNEFSPVFVNSGMLVDLLAKAEGYKNWNSFLASGRANNKMGVAVEPEGGYVFRNQPSSIDTVFLAAEDEMIVVEEPLLAVADDTVRHYRRNYNDPVFYVEDEEENTGSLFVEVDTHIKEERYASVSEPSSSILFLFGMLCVLFIRHRNYIC